MSSNLQFLDDPDDVPFINQSLTLYVDVNGSDTENNGTIESPFRSLGKAVDVVRNKQITKTGLVTIQLGAAQTNRTGRGAKKYFEEEDITIDFDTAKRLKIKGTTPTDHEVIGVNYFDAATDRDGFYCQILVTNQDKINIGDYLAIYDHLILKKKDPSYYWVRNNLNTSSVRGVSPNNCYVEAIRSDMIAGVHEVVDVSEFMGHEGNYANSDTELFEAADVKVGLVTVHIRTNNYTYNRLSEVPFWNSIGTMAGKQLFTYAAGSGNSPQESLQNNSIPPIFYGADTLSNPQTLEANGYEQFFFANAVQQIEIVDIMVRGYGKSLTPLNGKIRDPRTQTLAPDATVLWNDKTLTGYNRVVVATPIVAYFYKRMIADLGIDKELPFYFGLSTNPFITLDKVVISAQKVRNYLLTGASLLEGVPPWEEDNHPGYGYGPFESGAVRDPIGGGADVDTGSYPSEYADSTKQSVLLRYYNIYPPINGQLYQPILVKRIKTWYNENAALNGLQLAKNELKGNESPFFCGYITPQGWYKKRYNTNPDGQLVVQPIPSLTLGDDLNGYHLLIGATYPQYLGNTATSFNSVVNGSRGVASNERSAAKNLYYFDEDAFVQTTGTAGRESVLGLRDDSMGNIWFAGSVNEFPVQSGGGFLSQFGAGVIDRYSFGYSSDTPEPAQQDLVQKKTDAIPPSSSVSYLYGEQSKAPRAKCFKSILRFSKSGILVKSKTKLGLIKDLCLLNIGRTPPSDIRYYGIAADGESVVNASNIAVVGFSCGISARNQSLVNLLADLGNYNDINKGMFKSLDPGAICTRNSIGIESTLKSHVNAKRTVSSGSLKANYLCIANSSMDCSNSMSVSGFSNGYVCEFNSYMKATNAFSEFNGGIGFVCANGSILVAHRSRSIWNGNHGVLAKNNGTVKAYEFISRGNDGDGFLAQNHSKVFCGANSTNWANYRYEILQAETVESNTFDIFGIKRDFYTGIYSTLPPHLFQVFVVPPEPGVSYPLPRAGVAINSNPTQALNMFFHECNSTISEFNSGSGFASETDSILVADNTIARYNSKKYGEFFVYGWSGTRGSIPTSTFGPTEGLY
jgi:hypothetical protein